VLRPVESIGPSFGALTIVFATVTWNADCTYDFAKERIGQTWFLSTRQVSASIWRLLLPATMWRGVATPTT